MNIRRCHTIRILPLLALLAMLAFSAIAQQQTPTARNGDPTAPVTYSEQLRELLKSDESDAEDRTYDILHKVETHLINIRQQNGKLRAAMVHSSSATTKDKLAKYEQAAKALNDIKHAVAEIQENLTGCINMCAKAEHAAAEGRPGPEHLGLNMNKFISHAETAHKDLQKAIGELDKLKNQLDDPKLPGMVDYLASETKALGAAIGYSKQHVAQLHGDEGEQSKEKPSEHPTSEHPRSEHPTSEHPQ